MLVPRLPARMGGCSKVCFTKASVLVTGCFVSTASSWFSVMWMWCRNAIRIRRSEGFGIAGQSIGL